MEFKYNEVHLYSPCYGESLHRPIVIIDRQYKKGEIYFINDFEYQRFPLLPLLILL